MIYFFIVAHMYGQKFIFSMWHSTPHRVDHHHAIWYQCLYFKFAWLCNHWDDLVATFVPLTRKPNNNWNHLLIFKYAIPYVTLVRDAILSGTALLIVTPYILVGSSSTAQEETMHTKEGLHAILDCKEVCQDLGEMYINCVSTCITCVLNMTIESGLGGFVQCFKVI